MKVDARGFEALLRAPDRIQAVLLFGEDAGLVHARAATLVRTVAGRLDDPFLVTELSPEQIKKNPGGVADAVATLPMGGGRMVVRVRDAGDAMLGAVQAMLEGQGPASTRLGLLVLEAGALTPRSKLRVLFERAAGATAVACYPLEPPALAKLLGAELRAAGLSLEADTLALLARLAGPGMETARGEAAKLALYMGATTAVSAEDVLACCAGDAAGLADDAYQAAAAGNVANADAALERAMAEGATAVGIVRGALLAFQRLRQAALLVAGGMSAADAGRALRPPVFFRQQAPFARAMTLWSVARLDYALSELWACERACKSTGSPAELLARRAVLSCAQEAARRAARARVNA